MNPRRAGLAGAVCVPGVFPGAAHAIASTP